MKICNAESEIGKWLYLMGKATSFFPHHFPSFYLFFSRLLNDITNQICFEQFRWFHDIRNALSASIVIEFEAEMLILLFKKRIRDQTIGI